jgi:bifunctional DNA-binding transcriptional regulator/antitoxin component of YhaV-PrlF toxin-antitoxin module
MLDDKQYKGAKDIAKTWITVTTSTTLVIPREIAKEYGLDKPSHVIVEKTAAGILIRKLEV